MKKTLLWNIGHDIQGVFEKTDEDGPLSPLCDRVLVKKRWKIQTPSIFYFEVCVCLTFGYQCLETSSKKKGRFRVRFSV